MKKTLILASFLALAPFAKGQLLLEALEGGVPFTPSEKCLERVYDKHYGDGDHNFIYCAVMGPNGKKWLNHNLGAEYTKESSPHFNPEAVPTNYNDWKAYGSLFQEGRDADGHELGEYIQHTYNSRDIWAYKFKNDVRQTPVPVGQKSNQVTKMKEWKANTPEYWAGWQGSEETNPCPSGYQVMTIDHAKSYIQFTKPYNSTVGWGATSYIVHYNDYPNLYLMISPAVSEMQGNLGISVARRSDLHGGSSTIWIQRKVGVPAQGKIASGWENITGGYAGPIEGNPNGLDSYYWFDDFSYGDMVEYPYGLINENKNAMAIRCVEK